MNTKQFLLFPMILLFGVFAANAQNSKINSDYHPLVQEGKVWSVVLVMGDGWDYYFTTTQMTFWGDTTINDIQYKKMYASTKEYPVFPQDWILQNFMREDENRKVWYDKRINIYPNPANNVIFIENIDNLEIRTISILNTQGQIVRRYEPTATQLDVSDITGGIYFIKISSSKGVVIRKLIKL